MKIDEQFAFLVEKVGIFDETIERGYPVWKIERWRDCETFERFDKGISGDSDKNEVKFARGSN